eukprot:3268551-Amphidinium_carterae.1
MTLEYIAHLPGDTPDDDIRRQQIERLEDDIESINDAEHYENRQDRTMDDEEDIPEQPRQRQSQERKLRRATRSGPVRFSGTKKELQRMRDALLDIIVARRRQRLQERERTRPASMTAAPKAPPFAAVQVSGTLQIQQRVNSMTLQELQDQVRREDVRIAQHKGGYY